MEGVVPLTPALFAGRGRGEIPAWALEAARDIAAADRILIAAPFWDMSFPAVLKAFFEQVSLFGITFEDNGNKCVGLCKCKKVRPEHLSSVSVILLYVCGPGMFLNALIAPDFSPGLTKKMGLFICQVTDLL